MNELDINQKCLKSPCVAARASRPVLRRKICTLICLFNCFRYQFLGLDFLLPSGEIYIGSRDSGASS